MRFCSASKSLLAALRSSIVGLTCSAFRFIWLSSAFLARSLAFLVGCILWTGFGIILIGTASLRSVSDAFSAEYKLFEFEYCLLTEESL
jgi:hypothetical protein